MATRTVKATFRVNGVPTDPTSAVLSDEAGDFGIKRDDTGAVVVAAETEMSREAEGVYSYTFTATEGVAYTAWVQFEYGESKYWSEHDFPAITPAEESGTTSVSFTELRERVSRFLFGARSIEPLSADQVDDIDACIKDGLQAVYSAHRWSFFRPRQSITTVADQSLYDLPAEFDAIAGPFSYAADSGEYHPSIPVVHESEIRRRRQNDNYASRPRLAAVVSAEFVSAVGSKRQVEFYPTPDDEYVLTAVMRLRPLMLDVDNPYPLGGETLAPVIIESCLAAAERTFRDTAEEVHSLQYRDLLAAAIVEDAESASPDTLGRSVSDDELESGPHPHAGVSVFIDNELM